MGMLIPELCKVLGTNHLQSVREFVHTVDSLVEQAKPGMPSEESLINALKQFGATFGFEAKPYSLCKHAIWGVRLGASANSPLLLLDVLDDDIAGAAGYIELVNDSLKHMAEELALREDDSATWWDEYGMEYATDSAEFLGVSLERFLDAVRGMRGIRSKTLADWYDGETGSALRQSLIVAARKGLSVALDGDHDD